MVVGVEEWFNLPQTHIVGKMAIIKDYNPYTKKEDTAFPQTRWVEAQ
jgi:hypothetical protein